jgi:pilus assembly protein Flp/PilA
MRWKLWSCYSTIRILLLRDEGQDLVEYALLVAMIAFATTAGMQAAAGGVNGVFTTIGATIRIATN